MKILFGLIFLLLVLPINSQEKDCFNLQLNKNKASYVIEFVNGHNQNFYDFLLDRLNLRKVKQGQFPHEKLLLVYEFNSKTGLDSINIKTIEGTGLYNNDLITIFKSVNFKLSGLPIDRNDYSITFQIYIWEENGDFELRCWLN